MIASHLLKWCHFCQDWGYPPLELHFMRDKEKREVDFLITREKKPWLLIETKLNDTTPPQALRHFAEKLGDVQKLLVVRDCEAPGRAAGIPILDGATFCAALPV